MGPVLCLRSSFRGSEKLADSSVIPLAVVEGPLPSWWRLCLRRPSSSFESVQFYMFICSLCVCVFIGFSYRVCFISLHPYIFEVRQRLVQGKAAEAAAS